jgi:hypothetical protein
MEQEYTDYSCSTSLERLSRDIESVLRKWHLEESDRHVSSSSSSSNNNVRAGKSNGSPGNTSRPVNPATSSRGGGPSAGEANQSQASKNDLSSVLSPSGGGGRAPSIKGRRSSANKTSYIFNDSSSSHQHQQPPLSPRPSHHKSNHGHGKTIKNQQLETISNNSQHSAGSFSFQSPPTGTAAPPTPRGHHTRQSSLASLASTTTTGERRDPRILRRKEVSFSPIPAATTRFDVHPWDNRDSSHKTNMPDIILTITLWDGPPPAAKNAESNSQHLSAHVPYSLQHRDPNASCYPQLSQIDGGGGHVHGSSASGGANNGLTMIMTVPSVCNPSRATHTSDLSSLFGIGQHITLCPSLAFCALNGALLSSLSSKTGAIVPTPREQESGHAAPRARRPILEGHMPSIITAVNSAMCNIQCSIPIFALSSWYDPSFGLPVAAMEMAHAAVARSMQGYDLSSNASFGVGGTAQSDASGRLRGGGQDPHQWRGGAGAGGQDYGGGGGGSFSVHSTSTERSLKGSPEKQNNNNNNRYVGGVGSCSVSSQRSTSSRRSLRSHQQHYSKSMSLSEVNPNIAQAKKDDLVVKDAQQWLQSQGMDGSITPLPPWILLGSVDGGGNRSRGATSRTVSKQLRSASATTVMTIGRCFSNQWKELDAGRMGTPCNAVGGTHFVQLLDAPHFPPECFALSGVNKGDDSDRLLTSYLQSLLETCIRTQNNQTRTRKLTMSRNGTLRLDARCLLDDNNKLGQKDASSTTGLSSTTYTYDWSKYEIQSRRDASANFDGRRQSSGLIGRAMSLLRSPSSDGVFGGEEDEMAALSCWKYPQDPSSWRAASVLENMTDEPHSADGRTSLLLVHTYEVLASCTSIFKSRPPTFAFVMQALQPLRQSILGIRQDEMEVYLNNQAIIAASTNEAADDNGENDGMGTSTRSNNNTSLERNAEYVFGPSSEPLDRILLRLHWDHKQREAMEGKQSNGAAATPDSLRMSPLPPFTPPPSCTTPPTSATVQCIWDKFVKEPVVVNPLSAHVRYMFASCIFAQTCFSSLASAMDVISPTMEMTLVSTKVSTPSSRYGGRGHGSSSMSMSSDVGTNTKSYKDYVGKTTSKLVVAMQAMLEEQLRMLDEDDDIDSGSGVEGGGGGAKKPHQSNRRLIHRVNPSDLDRISQRIRGLLQYGGLWDSNSSNGDESFGPPTSVQDLMQVPYGTPVGRLLSEICFYLSRQPSPRMMMVAWSIFVDELKTLWNEGLPLPNMAVSRRASSSKKYASPTPSSFPLADKRRLLFKTGSGIDSSHGHDDLDALHPVVDHHDCLLEQKLHVSEAIYVFRHLLVCSKRVCMHFCPVTNLADADHF